jgi:hypothetical protein
MMVKIVLAIILLIQAAYPGATLADGPVKTAARLSQSDFPSSWPRIISGASNPDCKTALRLAKIAFRSDLPHIYDAVYVVKAREKSLVLWPMKLPDEPEIVNGQLVWPEHVEGDDLIPFDPHYIHGASTGGSCRAAYVEKKDQDGALFAVRQYQLGQNDAYDLLVIRSKESPEKNLDRLSNTDFGQNTFPPNVKVVTTESYNCPWIFHNGKDNHTVAIDTQQVWLCLSDWLIYTKAKDGSARLIGKIAFKPEGKNSKRLLPKGPLYDMAILLDQIIGIPKNDEGTLQPTAGLRLQASHMWGNLIYRPWAMEKPKNSRKEVEAGLKRWRKGSPVYKEQYERLWRLYPQANDQLTNYYETAFHLPHERAAGLGKKNMDLALRSNFNY